MGQWNTLYDSLVARQSFSGCILVAENGPEPQCRINGFSYFKIKPATLSAGSKGAFKVMIAEALSANILNNDANKLNIPSKEKLDLSARLLWENTDNAAA